MIALRKPRSLVLVLLSLIVVAGLLVTTRVENTTGDRTTRGAPLPDGGGELSGTVWTATEVDGSLSAVDLATAAVVTTVGGVPGAHNVQASPDGTAVWAVSSGTGRVMKLDASGADRRFDSETGTAPAHVVLSPDGGTVYAANSGSASVSVFDAATGTRRATVAVGEGPHGLRTSPDGCRLYVANTTGRSISVLDTGVSTSGTLTEVNRIALAGRPIQVAPSPDGTSVYVTLNDRDALVRIRVADGAVDATLPVGDGPAQVTVTRDGAYALVANQGTADSPGRTVSIVATATFSVIASPETGAGPHGIAVDPSSRRAFVTHIYGDDLGVLDLETRRVIARVPVGAGPNGVTYTPVQVRDDVPARRDVQLSESGASGGDHEHSH